MFALIKIDDEFIPLVDCNISSYQHNIYITSDNSGDIFNFLYKFKSNDVFKSDIQLMTEKTLTIIKSCVFQDIKFVENKIHINIIGDEIIKYDDPSIYVRGEKIKKIINNISEKSI